MSMLISDPGGMLDEEARELPDVAVRFCGELSRSIRPVADFQTYRRLQRRRKWWARLFEADLVAGRAV